MNKPTTKMIDRANGTLITAAVIVTSSSFCVDRDTPGTAAGAMMLFGISTSE